MSDDATTHAPVQSAQRLATIGERICARLADLVLLAIAFAVVVAPVSLATTFMPALARTAIDAIIAVITAGTAVAVFAFMESAGRRTPGKTVLGLQVVKAGGQALTLREAALRNVWTGVGVLSVVPIAGPVLAALATFGAAGTILVSIANSDVRQGWHDRLAGGSLVSKPQQ